VATVVLLFGDTIVLSATVPIAINSSPPPVGFVPEHALIDDAGLVHLTDATNTARFFSNIDRSPPPPPPPPPPLRSILTPE
jgi:hypothetical protein